jgi:hypothetical protein
VRWCAGARLSPPNLPSSRRKILALALSVIVLATGVSWIFRYRILESARGEEIYPDACRWAAAVVPPNSVIAAMQMTGAMKYYTDLTFARIDWIEPADFPSLRSRIQAAGYHWYALVGPAERELLQKNLPGAWKEVARLRRPDAPSPRRHRPWKSEHPASRLRFGTAVDVIPLRCSFAGGGLFRLVTFRRRFRHQVDKSGG